LVIRRQPETGDLIVTSKLVVLGIAWAAWGALHSGMISIAARRCVERRAPRLAAWYRLAFNAVSVAAIVPVIAYQLSLEGSPVFAWPGAWVAAKYAMWLAAAALFVMGGRQYDMLRFVGLRQVLETESADGSSISRGLCKDGVLGFVRHPWYAATILVLWARNLDTVWLVAASVLTAYVIVGTILEERKLVLEFGDEYRRYQREVSMLFPAKWLLRIMRGRP
jgi:protein-S-isoprenylcysteine O-methyltransferase Ste14